MNDTREYAFLIKRGAEHITNGEMTRDDVIRYMADYYPSLSFRKVIDDMDAALKRSEFPEIGRFENMVRCMGRASNEIRKDKPRFDESFRAYADRMSQNTRAALWASAELAFPQYSEEPASVMAMIALRAIAYEQE